jgi:RNA polymerase sigma factor (sigma-70 family)
VAAGDRHAYEELYRRYRKPVAAYVFRWVRDWERAEEIAQDVFLSVFRRLPERGSAVRFRPWVLEIARNAAIDDYRVRQRRVTETSLSDMEDHAVDTTSLRSVELCPDRAVERRQSLGDLQAAFGGLPDRQHRILVMREFEGRTYDEIGRRMELSRSQVESLLFRARRKLADEYRDIASGQRCEHVRHLMTAPDRTLGQRERRHLETHLDGCRQCRREAHGATRTAVAA